MNLGFVILYVDNTEQSKAFYTNVLGMVVVEEISGPNFVTLRPGSGSLIGLQDKTTAQFAPKDEAHAGSMELSFAVEDVDATWNQWKSQSVEILSDPVDLPFGRYFLAKDPDGHYLSVYRFAQQA